MITCEFCGTQAEQHDHWRHLIMGRVAALEKFVCKADGASEESEGGEVTESERVWAEIRAMADRIAKLEADREHLHKPPAEQPSRQETVGGETGCKDWCGFDGSDGDAKAKEAVTCSWCSGLNGQHEVFCTTLAADLLRSLNKPGALAIHRACAPIVRKVAALEAKLAQAERERDERGRQVEQMAEHVATMRVERDEARDCGQEGEVCKVPPGCQHHWELRARELLRERNEATARERELCLATAVYHGAIETASGIRSGAPAPKCDPDQPREDREGRTHRHRLKVWPPFFDDIIAGRKSFEIRKNDRDFKVGDEWVAEEYRPGYGFTGVQSSPFTITYVTPPSDCIPAGYCGFQFEKSRRIETEPTPSVAPDRTQSK